MQYRQNLPVLRLLIIVSVLAVAGGLTTVLVTSPQSFELARLAFFQSTITPESTLPLTSTPTYTSMPATPTPGPTATSNHPISVPSATSIPTAQQTSTRRPAATATATGGVLPPDVRALAFVTGRVGSLIVRVRDLPNGAQVIAAIPGGTVLQVLFGQSVVDGIEWLQVRLASGRVGWIAGYLLTITIERPPGTDTTEAPATQVDTSTPVPATAPPNSTGQPPPGPTATPVPTGTAINPPVPPPPTATNAATATLPPISTEAPTAAPTTVFRPPPSPTSASAL